MRVYCDKVVDKMHAVHIYSYDRTQYTIHTYNSNRGQWILFSLPALSLHFIPNGVVFGCIEAEFYVDSIVLYVYTTDAYVHTQHTLTCNRTCSVTQCIMVIKQSVAYCIQFMYKVHKTSDFTMNFQTRRELESIRFYKQKRSMVEWKVILIPPF